MYHKFISEDATISKERYKYVFTHLWEALRLKEPEMCVTEDWVLLQDSALEHWLLLVQLQMKDWPAGPSLQGCSKCSIVFKNCVAERTC